ncbi:MAG: hypothetical protein HY074_02205 [Deltaproteobacteria bacterium]|nr:hypothetical protein [Deltaproteobacteria bacterium]
MKVSMFLVVSCALVFASAAGAAYYGPVSGYQPICGLGISYDSYGRGIEDGFKSTLRRAKQLDENCYDLGKQFGAKTRAENNWSFCVSDFDHGMKDGYALSSQSPDGECYSQGYKAGEAALDIDAREGKAAPACQQGYADGVKAWNAGQPASVPGDLIAAHCYQMGYFDASALSAR